METYLNGNKEHVEDCLSTMNSSTANTPLLQPRETTNGLSNKFQRKSPTDIAPEKRKSLLLSSSSIKGETLARRSLEFFDADSVKLNNSKQITFYYMEETTSSIIFNTIIDLPSDSTFEGAMKEFLRTIESEKKPCSDMFKGLRPQDFEILKAKKDGSPNRDYPAVDLEQKVGKLSYSSLFVEAKKRKENTRNNITDFDAKIIEYEEKMERSSSNSIVIAEKLYGNSLRKILAEDKKTSMISDKPKNSLLYENLKSKNCSNNTTFMKEEKRRRTCLFCYTQE